MTLMGLAVALMFGALFVRLWVLQVLAAPRYQAQVITNTTRMVRVPAPRGLIIDRAGKVLAGDQTVIAVAIPRTESAAHAAVLTRLAAVLEMTPAQLQARLADPRYSPYQPIPVAIGVPIQAVVFLREHAAQFPGVKVEELSQRDYPSGALGAQTLGYVGPISAAELARLGREGYTQNSQIGQSGLEAAYQTWLRGRAGVQRLAVDAQGRTISSRKVTSPRPGDNLVTTLDARVQAQVEGDLARQIHSLDGTRDPTDGRLLRPASGAAIVMDPRNGSVLAMASYPSYNPTVWDGGISVAAYQALSSPSSHYPLLNRAIDGLYTPGSTFKLATATAALATNLITPNTYIDDHGVFTIPHCRGKCTFHNANYEALGPISIEKAIGASDDVFFYNLGYDFWAQQSRYGATPIQNTAASYGMGQITGIPLPGEAQGRVDSPSVRSYLHSHYPSAFPNGSWYAGDNLEMAFGQGGTVLTPIELAQAYATFANGGTRYQPRLARAVVDPSGRTVKTFPPIVTGHVSLPASIRDPMLAGFEDALSQPYGTAYSTFAGFPLNRLQVAGKTGTASSVGHNPTSLFVGFAPATNPRYVVAVVVDRAGYGSSGAGPVARSIFTYLMNHPVAPAGG